MIFFCGRDGLPVKNPVTVQFFLNIMTVSPFKITDNNILNQKVLENRKK